MEKNIVPGKAIEITKQDKRITVSGAGIEIQHRRKAIKAETAAGGAVYLVIDCSGSMIGNKLDQAKKGAINFAKEAHGKGYAVGLIKFDDEAIHLSEPSQDILALSPIVGGLTTNGGTNMSEAIRLATKRLDHKTGSRTMVIVTDGMPNSIEDALHEAEQAKTKGIDIIAIGTDDADREFLAKLATRTDLGIKVAREQFEFGIISTAKMLPQLGGGQSGSTTTKR